MFPNIVTKAIHVDTIVLLEERKLGTKISGEEIDEFRLISRSARMSEVCSKSNDSTLQKLIRIAQMLEKKVERYRRLSDELF